MSRPITTRLCGAALLFAGLPAFAQEQPQIDPAGDDDHLVGTYGELSVTVPVIANQIQLIGLHFVGHESYRSVEWVELGESYRVRLSYRGGRPDPGRLPETIEVKAERGGAVLRLAVDPSLDTGIPGHVFTEAFTVGGE